MNRRQCINCQTTWNSLADHELESPHTCPLCGDELRPVSQPGDAEKTAARVRS